MTFARGGGHTHSMALAGRTFLNAALAIAALTTTAPGAHAGTLCGRVTDAATQAPIPQAGVFVRTPAGAYTGDYAATGADGRYCISLAAGTYDLEFRRDNFVLSYVRGVVVTDDVTSVETPAGLAAAQLALPHPNPARESAALTLRVPRAGAYRVAIVDLTGRLLRGWEGRAVGPEERRLIWNLRDAQGRAVRAGRYVVTLTFEGTRLFRHLTVIR